ncbi:MAG: hypothetical protein K2H43_01630, partial [Clostridia bacterium]|nr:hypothetical protein [Clostridia bacterium]
YLIDFFAFRRMPPVSAISEAHAFDHGHLHGEAEEDRHDHEDGHGHGHGEYSACEHKRGKESNLSLYLVSPLLHALKIAAFILAVNLLFGFLFFGIGGGNSETGEERVIGFLQGAGFWYQPLVCCLVGLIPNCASSVALAQTYAVGGIAFGSLLAGLSVNAGLGYLVLLRDYKRWKRAAGIAGIMLAVGLLAGYCVNAIGLAIPPL